MTPAWTRTRQGTAFATAALALACLGAPAALAMQTPEPRSDPAEGPGSPLRSGNRILTEVRFEDGALGALDDLRGVGAQIIDASRRYQTVTVAATPAQGPALDDLPGVENTSTVLTPVTSAACGSVNSEGDTLLTAAEARADFGVDGSGITVGILSDSFDTDSKAATSAAADIASGDLPGSTNPCGLTTPVGLFDDSFATKTGDEGRAMAQVVHDLAPGAKISFATAFKGETAFANSIRGLAAAGASVIVDDVNYFEEPFFQDGPVAVAIGEVVAKGVTYFSAVGNDNLIAAGRNIASWEAPTFRDAGKGCPPQLNAAAPVVDNCLDFDPGNGPGEDDNTFGITVQKDATLTVDVQWAEPLNGVDADIDIYLLDSTGNPLSDGKDLVGSTNNNVGAEGTQKPAEVFSWENEGPQTEVELAINRCFGPVDMGGCNDEASTKAKPRVKVILLENGKGVSATEYPQSSGGDIVGPTVFGHTGSAAAISLGAVGAGVANAPEAYSSRGPVTHYFGPAAGPTPAAGLLETIPKPNVVATDCGRTTFFVPTKSSGIFRFCGTSAAAPHAAAIAALALQANATLTPEQVRDGLAATARPVGTFGPNAVGAGILDAHRMIEDVALPPAVSIVNPPPAVTRNALPSIGFRANRPVSFACSIDGGEPLPCTSPFTPLDPLRDGLHAFAVRGEDLAGRVGVSETIRFTVDTVAPQTSFSAHPRRNLRTRKRRAKAVFGFRSSEPGSTFSCRVDGGLVRYCADRLVRRFGVGRHVLRVMAVDAAGNIDQTPATFRFKVKHVGSGSRR